MDLIFRFFSTRVGGHDIHSARAKACFEIHCVPCSSLMLFPFHDTEAFGKHTDALRKLDVNDINTYLYIHIRALTQTGV